MRSWIPGGTADPACMPVERILSLREPRGAAYLGFSLFVAVLVAWGLDLFVRHMLRDLTTLAADSPDAAALQAASWLTGLTVFFCLFTLLVSGALFQAFRQAARERCMPPPGLWRIGAVRQVSGEPAVRLARAGQVLAIAMALCGVALGIIAWWFVSRVVACAARQL